MLSDLLSMEAPPEELCEVCATRCDQGSVCRDAAAGQMSCETRLRCQFGVDAHQSWWWRWFGSFTCAIQSTLLGGSAVGSSMYGTCQVYRALRL